MRSPAGLAAAVTMLLALPVAIVAAQVASESAAELVIHLAIGSGCVLLAIAALDFGLPKWVAWLGAASAGAFGGIFLLQAMSQIVPNEALRYVAFDVLGQAIEGVLPYLIQVWFIALFIAASHGKSRILGAITMSVVLGFEIAGLVGPVVGLDVPSLKVLFLLPFVWLLFESAKRPSRTAPSRKCRSDPPSSSGRSRSPSSPSVASRRATRDSTTRAGSRPMRPRRSLAPRSDTRHRRPRPQRGRG